MPYKFPQKICDEQGSNLEPDYNRKVLFEIFGGRRTCYQLKLDHDSLVIYYSNNFNK